MKAPRFFSLAVALVLIAIVFTGCSDSPFESSEAPIAQEGTSKMRQSHLFASKFLSRAKVLERYAELAATNDFVLGMNKVLERYRVLERYDGYDGVAIKKNYERTIDGFAVHVDGTGMTIEEFLAIVELDQDIEWIEPDIRFVPPLSKGSVDKKSTKQFVPYTTELIGARESWTVSGDGNGTVAGVDVYIMDTGVAHEDLNVVESVNFADDEMVENPMWEHGTHVAGTVGAMDDDNGSVGVAPGVRLHNLRVLNNLGQADLSAAIAAVEYVTEQKLANPAAPIVVNISFGGDIGSTEYNALDQAIVSSISYGVVYVIAAGNEAIDVQTVTPAHVQEAITVASFYDHSTNTNLFSGFSNYGSDVDLVAPGNNIKSLDFNSTAPLRMDGTSMAAPHVSGAAALFMAQNPSATPTQVLAALRSDAAAGGFTVEDSPAGTTDLIVWVGQASGSTQEPTAPTSGGGGKGGKGGKGK